ncbi:MAG TPA: ABC transporter ATP-binding protein [Jatrophihabitantaceae bacterium]
MGTTDNTGALQVRGLVKKYPGSTAAPAVNGVDFAVTEGHFYTLLGPSGCGKTTTLRCVAGLERPSAGSVIVDGQVLSNANSRHFVAPHRRPMGMVFQNYAIWPHLSVFDNVAFPLKVGRPRLRKKEIERRVEEALAVVQLSDYIHRPATNLSGGQQQRLALARALVREPKILLLDEPLSNLDAKLRDAMRSELRAIQRRLGITTLYVTHDQAEALSMSNRIAVMSEGQIVQEGTPREIYAAPRTRFVADFIGESNFLDGVVVGRADLDRMTISTSMGAITAVCPGDVQPGDAVTIGIRPQDLTTEVGSAHAGSTVRCTVEQVLYVGEHYDYQLRAGEARLAMRLSANVPRLRRGTDVDVLVPSTRVSVFSDEHGFAHVVSDNDDDLAGGDDLTIPTAVLSNDRPM